MIGNAVTVSAEPLSCALLTTTPIRVDVSTYAIGSLAPDSNSSSGRRLCFRPTPFVRSTENTLALSVLDMVAAVSKATQIDIV